MPKEGGTVRTPGTPVRTPVPRGTSARAQPDSPAAPSRAALDALNLRRVRPSEEEVPEPDPIPVSAGPIGLVVELAFNATREKLREFTVIDRMQARLFPLMDVTNTLVRYCVEIAEYRQSAATYAKQYRKLRPEQPNIMDDLMYRTAQWQKSREGKNLEKITDIALAEIETRPGNEEDNISGGRNFPED